MKVIALEMGFLNGSRVRKGTEFEVPDGTKGTWFAPVESPAAKAAKPVKAARPEPRALSQIGKGEDKSFIQVHEKADLA
jgi:hypothetical protein